MYCNKFGNAHSFQTKDMNQRCFTTIPKIGQLVVGVPISYGTHTLPYFMRIDIARQIYRQTKPSYYVCMDDIRCPINCHTSARCILVR